MGRALQMLRYQVRICWGPLHWAGMLFAMAFPVIFTPPGVAGGLGTGSYILDTTQTFLPLLGTTAMAGLLSSEYEGRTAETLLTTAFPRTGLLLFRYGLAALYAATLSCLVFGAYMAQGYIAAQEVKAGLFSSLVAGIYLGTLGLLAGLAARSTAAGLLVSAGYWLLEVFTKGEYTGHLYLFSRGDPRLTGPDKAMLLAVTATLLTGGIALFESRRD